MELGVLRPTAGAMEPVMLRGPTAGAMAVMLRALTAGPMEFVVPAGGVKRLVLARQGKLRLVGGFEKA